MSAPSTAAATRSLVFADGSSHKFWTITLDGASHTVTFGRVGTAGQTQTKEFDDEAAARKSFDKLVAEKTKKGYTDQDGSAPAAPATAAAATKPVAKTTAKKAAKAAASDSEADGEATAPTEPAPAKVAAPAAAAPAKLDATDEIDLAPEDWFVARFRPFTPLVRPEAKPFDRDAALAKLAKLKTTSYGWDVRWQDLDLPLAMTREEAHFWFVAMTEPRGRDVKMTTFAEKIAKKKLSDAPAFSEMAERLSRAERNLPPQVVLCLLSLMTTDEVVDALLAERPVNKQTWQLIELMRSLRNGVARYLLPCLGESELDEIRARLRKDWDAGHAPANSVDSFPAEYYLAAVVGMPEEIEEVVAKIPDDQYKDEYGDYYTRPQDLIFGLGSAERVEQEWRRLKPRFRAADDIRHFLACTGTAALDLVADAVAAETNKEEAETKLNALALVRSPAAAPHMLRLKTSSKAPAVARNWLETNVGTAVAGLLETAGGRGALADAAIDYLRWVKQQGHGDVLAQALDKAGPTPAAAKVRADVLEREEKTYEPLDDASAPAWLKEALAAAGSIKKKSLPSWASAGTLPPLTVGDKRLGDSQIAAVLQVLAATAVTEKHPLLVALREHVARNARDDFAWKLFQHWQEDGFPPKEKWAMGAIGHLGDDACVIKLTPLVRAWPGESQHARAVFGLECLRAIGSSTALMHLSGIGQKLPFKGLKTKAQQYVAEIAEERGLTRDELEDRVVPDCGLDEQGRRTFAFGPRSFSFVLSGDLKPMIRDEAGKVRPNLPDANAKDDAQLAEAAHAEWKLIKKQIKDVATLQAARLEQAMITGRRWKAEDFETLLVRHPLMTNLAQKLIWAGFDESGKRVVTFRVTEERDYADPEDAAASLENVATVGVVHPLELTDAERSAWGGVMGDYEVVPPFPQLGRPVHALEPGEEKQAELARAKGWKFVAPTLVFTLEKFGWSRGMGMDAGGFDEHSKQFPAADVTAVTNYDGLVGMGYIDPDETLTLERVYFVRGMRKPSGYGYGEDKALPLGEVSPIVISEVLADLYTLKAKAK